MKPFSMPQVGEYNPFFQTYIDALGNQHPMEVLSTQRKKTIEIFKHLTPEQANYRYAEGKWSPKEMFGHIIDTERIMSYRALCMARGEEKVLPGFDENRYVQGANFDARSMSSLIMEYDLLRRANIELYKSLSDKALQIIGATNGAPITARALVCITAGHELHHLGVLKARYKIG
jgi:DinB superfamily